ncbi:MAG: hypothetical protein Q8T11_08745 [Elusimicrobiota bacterium]|nr:hypothetical protein [Elusimicrobiota bacterium]
MNGKINGDGNIIGRLGAVALLIAAGIGLRNLTLYGQMCPMKSSACCSGSEVEAEPAIPPTAPAE